MPIISGQGGSGGGSVTRIFNTTLGADAASIDTGAGGIVGTYRHLIVYMLARSTRAAQAVDDFVVQFNADTGNNYYREQGQGLAATWTAVQSLTNAGLIASGPAATATAGFFASMVMDIPGYANTTLAVKSCLIRDAYAKALSTGNIIDEVNTMFWNNSAAITRLALAAANGNLLAGSSLQIYGVS